MVNLFISWALSLLGQLKLQHFEMFFIIFVLNGLTIKHLPLLIMEKLPKCERDQRATIHFNVGGDVLKKFSLPI